MIGFFGGLFKRNTGFSKLDDVKDSDKKVKELKDLFYLKYTKAQWKKISDKTKKVIKTNAENVRNLLENNYISDLDLIKLTEEQAEKLFSDNNFAVVSDLFKAGFDYREILELSQDVINFLGLENDKMLAKGGGNSLFPTKPIEIMCLLLELDKEKSDAFKVLFSKSNLVHENYKEQVILGFDFDVDDFKALFKNKPLEYTAFFGNYNAVINLLCEGYQASDIISEERLFNCVQNPRVLDEALVQRAINQTQQSII